MKKHNFITKTICSEFNIANIAKNYGITKKIKWEEPLILKGEILHNTKEINENLYVNKSIYLYHFGTAVFINFNIEEVEDCIETIKNIPNSIKNTNKDIKYIEIENYAIIEDSQLENILDFDEFTTSNVEMYHYNMISLVLAKSVALETIENGVDEAFDKIENNLIAIKSGNIKFNGKKTVMEVGKILSFKHTIISYIMLLDKPAITWKDQEAETFFNEFADLFELQDRYERINAKIEALLQTTQIITEMGNVKKATQLEWIVILLILIEVLNAFKQPFMILIKNLLSLIVK